MSVTRIVVAAVLVFVGASLAASGHQEPALSPVVERLLGEWQGEGTVTGRASSITMAWSLDLGGAFVHLRFRNVMAADAERPEQVFEGRGYYRIAGGTPGTSGTGTWIDSRGVIFPVAVALSADAFQSDWGSETTERGRTVYRLMPDGSLEVTDFVRVADGSYREFGRSVLWPRGSRGASAPR